MKRLALIYDYDLTLTTEDSSYSLTEFNIGDDFYTEVETYRKESNMEMILSCLYSIWNKSKENNIPLTKAFLNNAGKRVQYFKGVETWFERINEFGKKHGFKVEHYIISSGIIEIIKGGAISNKFKKIFASEFHYNNNGEADWPLASVNYTNKTQFIFRISKGILNNINDNELNDFMEKDKRAVQYKNMIYIGDGLTDVPCMKIMRAKKGYAIAVYNKDSHKAQDLYAHGRCDRYCFADYSTGSELDRIVKKRIVDLSRKSSSFKTRKQN